MTPALADAPKTPVAPPPSLGMEDPWPALGAFDEAGAQFFNGRATESAELRRMVVTSRLTVLFGASGLGKTSLLQAGLFPALRGENLLPVYVRLDLDGAGTSLMDQVRSRLKEELDHNRVEYPAFEPGESLWKYLHREGLELWSEQNRLLTPVLVFDQFEEMFTLGRAHSAAVGQLRTDLADLVEDRVPASVVREAQDDGSVPQAGMVGERYRVLIALREDYLPWLEGWKRDMPSLMRNRLRLLRMSRRQAFNAVHRTAPHLADEAISLEIVRFVAAAQETAIPNQDDGAAVDEVKWVEPALLSVVCSGLNKRRKRQNKATFDLELLSGTGKAIISDFYDDAIRGMPRRVQRFIEKELITPGGFRKAYYEDDTSRHRHVTPTELLLLVNRRLLRTEPQGDVVRVELTHDLLTGVVRERRQRRRRRYRSYLTAALVVVCALGAIGYAGWSNRVARNRAAEKLAADSAAAEQTRIKQYVDQVERSNAELKALVAEVRSDMESTQRRLDSVNTTIRGNGPAARDVRNALNSAQRSLRASSGELEATRIGGLVEQLNDPVREVRLAAYATLVRSESGDSTAIRLALDALSERKLGSLSEDGRVNVLQFLVASRTSAWSAEQRRLGRDAIRRINARADQPPRVGAVTRGVIDRLAYKIRA